MASASNGKEFSANVGKWATQTEQRLNAIFRESSKRVLHDMQTSVGHGGNMPVDTGFLRASLIVSLNGAVPMANRKPHANSSLVWNEGAMIATIAKATHHDRIVCGYTAVYARRLEYGFFGKDKLGRQYRQRPRAFVRSAIAKWHLIVAQVSRELKARVTAAAGGK